MAVYLGSDKVGVAKELGTDMLQARVDALNSCEYLFYYYLGTNVDYIRNLDTSKVTSMQFMFLNCLNLKSVDLSTFDFSNVTTTRQMFYNCKKLTEIKGHIAFSKDTDAESMFSENNVLTKMPSIDTSNVIKTPSMFAYCSKIVEFTGLNTSKSTNFYSMFQGCTSAKTIETLDLINATNLSSMFSSCTKLENLKVKNVKIKLQIGSTKYGTLLTLDSLVNTIKELWDLTGSTSQTLTMSTASKELIANVYVKLVDVTDEMLAQDQYAGNKKPCVVCESTDEGAMTLTEYATSKNWAIA